MSENYSFRSAMNGFNRNDVISYIESILAEREMEKFHVAQLKQELADSLEKIEELKKELEEQGAKKQDKGEECNNCDMLKAYEAKLGAAMFDAKRFSDILVGEANDKALKIFTSAAAAADISAGKAKAIADDINNMSDAFKISLEKLFSDMLNLADRLSGFGGELKTNSDEFVSSDDVREIFTVPQKSSDALNPPIVSDSEETKPVVNKFSNSSFTIRIDK